MGQNFKTQRFTLGSDVADAGTFTLNYPAGYSDGDFENSGLHYIVINGAKLEAPQDIGLSFGDTAVTVTNRTGSAILAGNGVATFFAQGRTTSVEAQVKSAVAGTHAVKKLGGRNLETVFIDFGSPITADADGIAASQSVSSGVAGLLNGALLSTVTTGLMILDGPYGRNVVAAWTGTAVLTVVGEDYLGQPMKESSGSGTTFTGKKAFKRITSYSFNANVTAATVGTGDVLGLPMYIPSGAFVTTEFENGSVVGAGAGVVDFPWNLDVADLATGTTAAYEIIAPFDCVITSAQAVVRVAIVTGGDVTFDVRSGTTVAGLTLTVADSATKGTIVTDTPTAAHASTIVAKGERIQVIPAAAFNGGGALNGTLSLRRTGVYSGTLVAGLARNTKSTATTADVRGTYDPATALDGTTNFALVAVLAEPYDIGNAQFNS